MATDVQIVIDCADPARLAEFWAGALGYQVQPPPEGYDSWDSALAAWGVPDSERNSASAVTDPDGGGPRIYFQRVPEPKTVKNRLHLDVNAGAGRPQDERRAVVEAEVDRLVGLGGTVLRVQEDWKGWCIVMQDPEGNEFCVQ